MSRIYIAGPMRGRELFNFPAFFMAAIQLRSVGLEPINPAEYDMALGMDPGKPMEDQGWTREECLQRDFKLIGSCHWIALLDGWEKSDGVRRELKVGKSRGIFPRSLEIILKAPEDYMLKFAEVSHG